MQRSFILAAVLAIAASAAFAQAVPAAPLTASSAPVAVQKQVADAAHGSAVLSVAADAVSPADGMVMPAAVKPSYRTSQGDGAGVSVARGPGEDGDGDADGQGLMRS